MNLITSSSCLGRSYAVMLFGESINKFMELIAFDSIDKRIKHYRILME